MTDPRKDPDHNDHGNLELNKIFAALLVAGIIAMLAGFFSREFVHVETPEKAVLDIDTSALEAAAAGAPAGPTGPEPILALLEKADLKRGEALSKACTACHSFDKDGKDGVGPNQWNLVMGPKGHRDGFAYSDALKELHTKGEKWTYTDLNKFIYKPQATIAGTKMNYLGLKKTEDRAALIAYLRTLADSPAPLPSNEDIQAEQAAFAATQSGGAKSKAATAAADAKAPAVKGKDAGATMAAPAAATKTGATPDAITNKPSADPSSSSAPLENAAPQGAATKQGDSAVPAKTNAVPPSATP